MLSKEERSKENLLSALQLLNCSRNCSACKYYSPDDIQKCQDPTPYAVDLLKELIEEHFVQKENTEEYKHFKLHSDSTLKNQTKKELIDYIKMLYHNWGVTDEQLKRIIDKAKELSDSNDELRGQLYFCEPYKFEDLKPNMWVWNDKRKRCFRLTDAFIRAGTKYYRWLDLSSGKLVRERFVEGQLYPPTKAMEYQEGN